MNDKLNPSPKVNAMRNEAQKSAGWRAIELPNHINIASAGGIVCKITFRLDGRFLTRETGRMNAKTIVNSVNEYAALQSVVDSAERIICEVPNTALAEWHERHEPLIKALENLSLVRLSSVRANP